MSDFPSHSGNEVSKAKKNLPDTQSILQFHKAVENLAVEEVNTLLENNPNFTDKVKNTSLIKAINLFKISTENQAQEIIDTLLK